MHEEQFSYVHKLVLTALMAAINIVFVVLNIYVPVLGLALVLFLPIASVIVALKVELRFYPIYFVTTLVLSFALSFGQIDTTLFLVLPSLIIGLTIGTLLRLNVKDIYTLLIVSAVTFLLMLLTIPLINLLLEVDFVATFLLFLGLSSKPYGVVIFPALMAMFSLAQTVLILYIVKFSRFFLSFPINEEFAPYAPLVALLLAALSFGLYFIYEPIALVLVLYSLVIVLYILITFYEKALKTGLIVTIAAVMITLFLITIFESLTSLPFYLAFNIMFVLIVITHYLWLYIDIKLGKEKDDG
ncbi:MAG TPA: DUF2232 domain-containing protein [Bacilli bacterium]|nr:DUF2232 domain-containing protein [Bacilli bacterium]